MSDTHEIRALLAPIPGSGVLLPGSVVAEVIAYSDPDPFRDVPDWLLGELEWNGWQIPVINFASLAGTANDPSIPPRSRILVVKTLTDAASILYIGFVISGLPRLRAVTTGSLVEVEADTTDGVFSYVTLDEQPAVIPDLGVLARVIEKAAYSS